MLFSDIEGSTVLLHRLGDRWGDVLAGHRRIVRAAIAAADGTETGTEGDSFFVVFGSAHDGVRAGLEAQRELQRQAWPDDVRLRVRMGLHTGEPQWQGEGSSVRTCTGPRASARPPMAARSCSPPPPAGSPETCPG